MDGQELLFFRFWICWSLDHLERHRNCEFGRRPRMLQQHASPRWTPKSLREKDGAPTPKVYGIHAEAAALSCSCFAQPKGSAQKFSMHRESSLGVSSGDCCVVIFRRKEIDGVVAGRSQ